MVVFHLQFQYKGWDGSYLSEKIRQNLVFGGYGFIFFYYWHDYESIVDAVLPYKIPITFILRKSV